MVVAWKHRSIAHVLDEIICHLVQCKTEKEAWSLTNSLKYVGVQFCVTNALRSVGPFAFCHFWGPELWSPRPLRFQICDKSPRAHWSGSKFSQFDFLSTTEVLEK